MRLHRHRWEPHRVFWPKGSPVPMPEGMVRRCKRCLRVEVRVEDAPGVWWFEGPWELQPRRDRLRHLRPFGFYLEVKRP